MFIVNPSLQKATMSCRVYIGRLAYQAREKDVERFFRGFGRIRDVNLKNGFGFVVISIFNILIGSFTDLCFISQGV